MKPVVRIQAHHPSKLVLRGICRRDIEMLRRWKNQHRRFFFHRRVITPEQQESWFQGYRRRDDDHMFIVILNRRRIGCIGLRVLAEGLDVYNVILSNKRVGGRGLMSQALGAVVSYGRFLYPGLPTQVKVLRGNPAISWYKKNGFQRVGTARDHVTMGMRTGTDIGPFRCSLRLDIPFDHPRPVRTPREESS